LLFSPLSYYIYNYKFYDRLYEKNGVYKALDRGDAKIITESVFDFFKNNEPFKSFKLKNSINFFNENEISHLNDVRILLGRIMIVFYISAALFIILLVLLFEKKYLFFLKNTALVLVTSSSILLFFLISLYILGNNFSGLFESFHLVFFPQGNWEFPQGALIITIFPFGFFYDFFFRLLMSSFIISLILVVTGVVILTITNKIIKRRTLNGP